MIEFIFWFIGVALAIIVAHNNGRNVWAAIFWSVLFSWGTFIVYMIIGKSFEKKLAEANALKEATTPNAPATSAPVAKKPRVKKTA